jgi:hypothetical protein
VEVQSPKKTPNSMLGRIRNLQQSLYITLSEEYVSFSHEVAVNLSEEIKILLESTDELEDHDKQTVKDACLLDLTNRIKNVAMVLY